MLREGHTWNEMLYLSFEDERLEGFESADFNSILECHIEMGGCEKPKMLSKEIMTTLGGRYLPVEVYPFSFTEYLRARSIPFDENSMLSTVGKAQVMREYAEYMKWGGLPESVGLPVKRNYLSSVFQKIYLGDICARNKISNPNLLRLMVKKMAESVKQHR